MAFATITVGANTYALRANGTYVNTAQTFGGPIDEFRIRANSNRKSPSAAITRVKQVDVTVGGVTQRVTAQVQMVVQVPINGMTAADVDALVTDLATFVDASVITRLMQGES